jgi:predicted branched-subunit amino acid permease
MKKKSPFMAGLTDGLPICFGYLSVSFAFGIFAVGSGLGVLETLFISMTNVTSAGQLAAVPSSRWAARWRSWPPPSLSSTCVTRSCPSPCPSAWTAP